MFHFLNCVLGVIFAFEVYFKEIKSKLTKHVRSPPVFYIPDPYFPLVTFKTADTNQFFTYR